MTGISTDDYTVPETPSTTVDDTSRFVGNQRSPDARDQNMPRRSARRADRRTKSGKPEGRAVPRPRQQRDRKIGYSSKETFEVEKILEHKTKLGEDGRSVRYFLVKWTGFGKQDNSWEPEENFDPDLISEYLKSKTDPGPSPQALPTTKNQQQRRRERKETIARPAAGTVVGLSPSRTTKFPAGLRLDAIEAQKEDQLKNWPEQPNKSWAWHVASAQYINKDEGSTITFHLKDGRSVTVQLDASNNGPVKALLGALEEERTSTTATRHSRG